MDITDCSSLRRYGRRHGRLLLVGAALAGCAATSSSSELPGDPASATFQIEDRAVSLEDGRAAWPAAPGSASLVETRLVGQPATGDIDGDGNPDAIVWLRQDSGGSGTFYYLAPAIRKHAGYQGGRAVLVGDRIAPGGLSIRNGVVFADFADRAAGQAMAVPPHVSRTRYLIWEKGALEAVADPGPGEMLLQGVLMIGHETREFLPCSAGAGQALWLLDSSPALPALLDASGTVRAEGASDAPLFVSLVARSAVAPAGGPGAAYPSSLEAHRLVNVWSAGKCPEPEQG